MWSYRSDFLNNALFTYLVSLKTVILLSLYQGIKDLRGQLVKNALELEQRTEQLADKGEMIDGLRAECQERRETERYNKHRLCNYSYIICKM